MQALLLASKLHIPQASLGRRLGYLEMLVDTLILLI
jgi:hypothetical protein